MKKIIGFVTLALLASFFQGPAAHAATQTIPLCSENGSVTCIQSVSITGSGLTDWTELQATPVFDGARGGNNYVFNGAVPGYAPASGYGTQIRLSGMLDYGPSDSIYISIDTTDGASVRQAFGNYQKHVDPSTQIRTVVNFHSQDTSGYNIFTHSFGVKRSESTSTGERIVTFIGNVARVATSEACNMGDCTGPADSVRDGILLIRAYAPFHTNPDEYKFFDGMVVDGNSIQSAFLGIPFTTNRIFFDGFSIILRAPHTLTDGQTLNTGYYSAVIPATSLAYAGTTQSDVLASGVSMFANYGDGVNSAINLNPIVEAADNGGVRVTAQDLHYSSPTVETKFRGISQSASVPASVKKGKKVTLPMKSTQELVLSWKSTTPKICKVIATTKTTKKKVGKKWVKTKSITKWQVQGKKKGTCGVLGTNAGSSNFKPASLSKSLTIS